MRKIFQPPILSNSFEKTLAIYVSYWLKAKQLIPDEKSLKIFVESTFEAVDVIGASCNNSYMNMGKWGWHDFCFSTMEEDQFGYLGFCFYELDVVCKKFNEQQAKNRFYCYHDLSEGLVLINSWLSMIQMDDDCTLYGAIDFSKHYMPHPYLVGIADSCKRFEVAYQARKTMGENNQQVERDKLYEKALAYQDSVIVAGVNYLKLETILTAISKSPCYTETDRKIAASMMAVLGEVLFNSCITDIRMESDVLTPEVFRKGTKNSTKLEIFFTQENGDRYCLRIDFPHEGVEYIHYNIHEPHHTAALPLPIERVWEIIDLCGGNQNKEKLFWEHNRMLWFRNDFEAKLREFVGNEDVNINKLQSLFHNQGHKALTTQDTTEKEAQEFLSILMEWLVRFGMSKTIYCRTQDVNIDDILEQIKALEIIDTVCLADYEMFQNEIIHRADCSKDREKVKQQLVNRMMENFKRVQLAGYSRDDLQSLALEDLLELLQGIYDEEPIKGIF